MGNAASVSLLANAATSQDAAEQKAARQALTELKRGDVTETMIAQLSSASPAVQVELIRALTARMDKSSAPRLLEMARTGASTVKIGEALGITQQAASKRLLNAGIDEEIAGRRLAEKLIGRALEQQLG